MIPYAALTSYLIISNIKNDHAKQVEANESGWKVIACRRLGASGTGEDSGVETSITKQGILAVVSIDRNLATFSIVQRWDTIEVFYKKLSLYLSAN